MTLPAIPDELNVGMEDFDESDMVMPTLDIDHPEGEYVDGLSKERYKELDVIALGLIKGRVLWPAELATGDAEPPLCKSYNHTEGRPDPSNPARFPWTASGFSYADYEKDPNPILPCEGCKLKEWGSHPKDDKPWCTEQFTFAIMLQTSGGGFSPALLTLQRTGIKPAQAYLTSFRRDNVPLFVVRTKLGLTVNRRGTVTYSVPTLTRGGPTDEADHAEFAAAYRRIRSFVQTPRSADADDEVVAETPVTVTTPSETTVVTSSDVAPLSSVLPDAAPPTPVVEAVVVPDATVPADAAPVAAAPAGVPVEATVAPDPTPAPAPTPAPEPVAAPVETPSTPAPAATPEPVTVPPAGAAGDEFPF